MRIAHLSLDEKFIDCAIDQFKALKGVDSTFCALANGNAFKYIKSENVLMFRSSDEMVDYINSHGFDYVVIHSLCISPRYLLKLNSPILWSSWGYDIYSDRSDPFQKILNLSLYKPLTRRAAKVGPQTLKDRAILVLRKFGILSKKQKRYYQLVKKIHHISVVLPSEYTEIRKRFPHLELYPFRYIEENTENEDTVLLPSSDEHYSQRILLGNSNDPTNNHLDILHKLNSIGREYEVFVPFSYPNTDPGYIQRVIDSSREFRNLKISFIRDYMPFDEYSKILKSCQSAIFGHFRQQAVGNISYMMKTGRNVFFYEGSTLYSFYKDNGYKVFSIDKELDPKYIETPLSMEYRKNNHQKNADDHDYQAYLQRLQAFFDTFPKQA